MKGRLGKFKMKPLALIASFLVVMLVSTGVLLAWINVTTEPVTNTFVPAFVTCAVNETFTDNVKSNVTVENTGNADAFVRAMVVATWVSEEDPNEIYAVQPQAGVDYAIEWNNSMWVTGNDGYYYYKIAIHPEEQTQPLIDQVKRLASAPAGYQLSVEIFATAIQSAPADVVSNVWPVYIDNGVLTPIT